MIEANRLTKWYGPALAVDDVTFSVSAGEVLGFIGPNGAGKTTTMKMLTTFIQPSSGRATVAGFDVVKNPIEVKKRIGYLPEVNPLYPDLKVKESLVYFAKLRGIPIRLRKTSIERVKKICNLDDVFEHEIRELSKGFRQRVGLAQALIHDPEILILDEPTSGLDPNQIVEVRRLIKEIGLEKTVMLSTHTLAEVALTCKRIMVINSGRLRASGSLAELREASGLLDSAAIALGGSFAGMEDALRKIKGVKKVHYKGEKDNMHGFKVDFETGLHIEEPLFALAKNRAWEIKRSEILRASLEDVFNALTVAPRAPADTSVGSPEKEIQSSAGESDGDK